MTPLNEIFEVRNIHNAEGLSKIVPYYIDGVSTFNLFATSSCPDGILNYAYGNAYWGISGKKGNNYVTVNSGIFADAYGDWAAVIIDDDGVCHMSCVTGNDGVDRLYIKPSLIVDITEGEIGCLHDSELGIHYTARGYKALAQHVYNASPKYSARNFYISKFRHTDMSGWMKIGSPFLTYSNAINIEGNPLMKHTCRALDVYCYDNGTTQGVSKSVTVTGHDGFIEFRVGVITADTTVTVEYWLDGVLSKTELLVGMAGYYKFDFARTNTTAEIRAYIRINSGLDRRFAISDTTWWISEKEHDDKMFPANSKIVLLGDSWGVFHNNSMAEELNNLLMADYEYPVQVINHSSGGKTTKYGLSFFYDYVIKEKPTHVIIEFFTNDINSINGIDVGTFIDSKGNTVDLNIVSNTEYRSNIRTMCEIAIENGIQPVVVCPCTHESTPGTLNEMHDYNCYLVEGIEMWYEEGKKIVSNE